MPDRLSRRSFVRLTGAGLALAPHLHVPVRSAADLTVRQAIDRIIAAVPGAPQPDSLDTVKAGDPDHPLTGIATTFLATRSVVERAARAGANLIVTHEPTFYNHTDAVDWLAEDPVYRAKLALIEATGVVVWRFHDYAHLYAPDLIQNGFLQAIGWAGYADADGPWVATVPDTTLATLAVVLRQQLGSAHAQVVGRPDMPVRRVAFLLGAWGGQPQIEMLGRADVDVLVVGEINEWETSEYVRDATHAGIDKGLVILGHVNSEEPGMAWVAAWLRDLFPDVDVTHVPSEDPFWVV